MPWGLELAEASKKYTDYTLAASMFVWTHPGFRRVMADPRSSTDPTTIQGMCAERLIQTLNLRNLLLDGGVMWGEGGMVPEVWRPLTPAGSPVGFTMGIIGNRWVHL